MAELPTLSISPEKAYFIVAKARQFDVKDGITDPDSGSNESDDGMRSVLQDGTDVLDGYADRLRFDLGMPLVAFVVAWFFCLLRSSKVEQKSGERVSPFVLDQ